MIYVNHTGQRIARRRAAELAAQHIAGVILRVGPDHAATLLAETVPHWTEESYRKASQPDQLNNLIEHIEQRITIIQ